MYLYKTSISFFLQEEAEWSTLTGFNCFVTCQLFIYEPPNNPSHSALAGGAALLSCEVIPHAAFLFHSVYFHFFPRAPSSVCVGI